MEGCRLNKIEKKTRRRNSESKIQLRFQKADWLFPDAIASTGWLHAAHSNVQAIETLPVRQTVRNQPSFDIIRGSLFAPLFQPYSPPPFLTILTLPLSLPPPPFRFPSPGVPLPQRWLPLSRAHASSLFRVQRPKRTLTTVSPCPRDRQPQKAITQPPAAPPGVVLYAPLPSQFCRCPSTSRHYQRQQPTQTGIA